MTNQKTLETELVAAFESMGFDDSVPLGGSGKPDGFAEARLGGTAEGRRQSYKVTLEAKSKESQGKKVTAKTVNVSAIVRHREMYEADFAVVVGPDFPTTQGEQSALFQEIDAARQANPLKGITLIRVEDMARLIRLVPAKRIGLDRLRDLFEKCSMPEESKKWIELVAAEKPIKQPYRELLESIYDEQQKMPDRAVLYGNVETHLRMAKELNLERDAIAELCKALSKMAPGIVYARADSVEIMQRPDKILAAIAAIISEYPEDEKKKITI